MRYTTLCLALSAVLAAGHVRASGIPVVDSANLLQKITEYGVILQQYDQLLKQTNLGTNQLLTLIDQYEQTLREYSVLLNQVEGLKDKITGRDYAALERELRGYAKQYSGEQESTNQSTVTRRYGSVDSRQSIDKLANEALGYVPDDVSQSQTLAGDNNTFAEQRVQFSQQTKKNREDSEHLDSLREGMGDQSQLATLQLLVEQNQLIINQLNLQSEMKLSELDNSNHAEQQQAQAVLKAKKRRLEKIKEANQTAITIDERPLR